jgi:hypothetical protein
MYYSFKHGSVNVHYLTAPYELLVKAFGDDGTTAPRDNYKSMCQWYPVPDVEVYDYKVGRCYTNNGLEPEQITTWNVQGETEAIESMLALLTAAGGIRKY